MIIRKLTLDDIDDYLKLLLSSENYKTMSQSQEINNKMIGQVQNDFTHNKKVIMGAFENNELIYSVGGFYPDNVLHWYVFRHIALQTQNKTLNFNKNFIIYSKCMYELIKFGEKINCYTFYSRRPLKDQLTFDKAYNRMQNEGLIESRYNYYYEKIYQINELCQSKNHEFYFKGVFEHSDVESVICIFLLKQSHREMLLNLCSPDITNISV